jgi:hypothetical protein
MDPLDRRTLEELLNFADGPCVTLTLPTHRRKESAAQDPVRLKNLIDAAEALLVEQGLKPGAARSFLEPASALADDQDFWAGRDEGLALYLAKDFFRPLRLPLSVDELALVYGRFHLTPLVPSLEPGYDFYVLAVSQHAVRLVKASRFAAAEVRPDGMPENLPAALNLDQPDTTLQWHSGPGWGKGNRAAMYHGQGGASDETKPDVLAYFRQIDAALAPLLAKEKAPLIFAGVDYLLPLYREANTYAHLHHEGIPGNPDRTSVAELHEQGAKLVAPRRDQTRKELLDRCMAQANRQGPPTLAEVLRAAYEGRVQTLLVAHDVLQWGRFDPASGKTELSLEQCPDTEELVNRATVETLLHAGEVCPMDLASLPGQVPVTATYRYPAAEPPPEKRPKSPKARLKRRGT